MNHKAHHDVVSCHQSLLDMPRSSIESSFYRSFEHLVQPQPSIFRLDSVFTNAAVKSLVRRLLFVKLSLSLQLEKISPHDKELLLEFV